MRAALDASGDPYAGALMLSLQATLEPALLATA
jgi:hypothetical protein